MHPQNPDILIAAAGNDPYLWVLPDKLVQFTERKTAGITGSGFWNCQMQVR